MKNRLITLLLVLCACVGAAQALTPEQLIPKPALITKGSGEIILSQGFTVSTTSPDQAIATELANFVADINATTGLNAKIASTSGFINVDINPTIATEGYSLAITPTGVTITASDAAGVFYAFQTLKRLLPANVMARQFKQANYTLPVVTIADEPRFEYRGFMLDVSRHFFDAAEVKKMLDLMATYKLNRFHWHLTDDQGWRLPISKYPLLTTKGATNKNILLTDFTQGKQWRAGENEVYGPYAYTTEEVRDIVAYAKARHIEVIPEIDMPGHMVAAIHCYPELSTDPESKLVAKASENSRYNDFSHEIWNKGGVSWDCLDVSNEKVYQFVNDVIDEVVELFPYEYIHIGGDETDLIAWENSPACAAKLAELGMTNYRALQSYFTKRVAEYAKTKGRKVMAWNEIVTHGGTDMEMIREIDPTIFCWIGGEAISEANGLKHVYTGFNGGYYINRSYRGFDRVGAAGDGALATTINVNPPLNQHCIGVQGTFWTEQVDRPQDMEYLALPRLMGIAEQGWSSTTNKNLDEFISRLIADKEYLDMAGYSYGAHQMVLPERRKPEADKWYIIKTKTTDDRTGRAWTLTDSNILTGTALDENSPAQHFKFVEDPSNPGHYAIVCKANPNGHLISTPTATTTAGRWNYATSGTLDYGFVLDSGYYAEDGTSEFTYAVRPASLSGYFLNFSKSGQQYAINVYNNPTDGNGGLMLFSPAPVPNSLPQANVWYYIKSNCTDSDRTDRVWSLDANGVLMGERQDRTNPAQLFRFIEDPNTPGHYAIVCKANPNGHLSSTPTATTTAGRWSYVSSGALDYGFALVDSYYGISGSDFYYAIKPANDAENHFMNFAMSGQSFAINVYPDPNSGNGGQMIFIPGEVIEEPKEVSKEDVLSGKQYFRLLTRFNGDASQPRSGSCIELVQQDRLAAISSVASGSNVQHNRLWHAQPADANDSHYDYQWFSFEKDPNSNYYAMVCKAKPQGSVKSEPSINKGHNTSRFDYDDTTKHYGFYLVDTYNGNSVQGNDEQGFFSALTSKDATSGWYMNVAAAGQKYAVHLYSNPTDQNAGIFTFEPLAGTTAIESTPTLPISSTDDNYYDLQGRRILAPTHGLYIHHGRLIKL